MVVDLHHRSPEERSFLLLASTHTGLWGNLICFSWFTCPDLGPIAMGGLRVTVIDRSTIITGTWGPTAPQRGGRHFTIHSSIYTLNVDYLSVRGQVPF